MPPDAPKCPKCNRRISSWDIATAFYPVWLKCKGCDAKLVGDKFVKIQGVAIPILAAGIGVTIAVRPKWDATSSVLACLLLFFAGAMVLATVRFGRYSLRRSKSDAYEEGESHQGEQGVGGQPATPPRVGD